MPVYPDFPARLRPAGDPRAEPAAVVLAGQARFTVLTMRLLRLEWSPDGVFEDRATLAVIHRRLEPPPFAVRTEDGTTVIDTGPLTLRYRPGTTPFGPDDLNIRLVVDGNEVVWTPGTPDPGNLGGTRRTLDNTAGPVTLGEGLISRSGWALLDDSGQVVLDPGDGWATARPGGGRRDWYFFGHGHDYRAALADFVRIGGPIPLVPRYVLGLWWSRYWAYSATDLAHLVDDFRGHGLPLDVLVLDMDWHRPGWTGYSWNRDLFPDPPGFLSWAHRQGLHVTLNLHPADGVGEHEDAYPAMARALGHTELPFRAADRDFMRAYFELLHHPLEDDGVDFWWLDWQQGETSELAGLDPLPWLNHLHFQDSRRRAGRPLIFSRWGGWGGHRHPVGFSGDTRPTWAALRFQPELTATGANVGAGWWSHDVGGHFGATDPELYTRWVQFGALSPVLRLHSNDDPAAERRPWAFGAEVLAAVRAAIRLRLQLLPYLYTYARVAADTGIALLRPMYLDHPGEEAAYHAPGQYQIGDQLIAAPITTPADPATGLAAIDVWIPPGVWADLATGERHEGPRWIRVTGGLQRIPLFARAGSVLPLADLPADTLPGHLGEIPADRLVLRIVAGDRGAFRLYEDDGMSEAHRRGEREWTDFGFRRLEDGRTEVSIGATTGLGPTLPRQRGYRLELDGFEPIAGVLVDGRPQPHGQPGETVIEVPAGSKTAPHTIIVTHRTTEPASPMLHVVPAWRPEQARSSLGHLIVAAPAAGPYDLTVTWRLDDANGSHRRVAESTDLHTDQILACPFPLAAGQPHRWSVHATVTWQGRTTEFEHRSPILLPAAGRWRADEHDAAWPTQIEHVGQPYLVSMFALPEFGEQLFRGLDGRDTFRTVVRSHTNRPVLIELHAYGSAELRLNGSAPAATTGGPVEETEPLMTTWIRGVEVRRVLLRGRLRAGDNDLVVHSASPPGQPWWEFSVVLRDLDGSVLTGIEYRTPPR